MKRLLIGTALAGLIVGCFASLSFAAPLPARLDNGRSAAIVTVAEALRARIITARTASATAMDTGSPAIACATISRRRRAMIAKPQRGLIDVI